MRSLKLISILYNVRIYKIKIGESIKSICRIMRSVIYVWLKATYSNSTIEMLK